MVGESGSGKSTLGRALLRLERPRDGAVVFEGREIQDMAAKALKPLRSEMQMVFQDPFGSLSPRLSIAQIVEEGFSSTALAAAKTSAGSASPGSWTR